MSYISGALTSMVHPYSRVPELVENEMRAVRVLFEFKQRSNSLKLVSLSPHHLVCTSIAEQRSKYI